jgi:hypothetical protein
MIKEYDSMLSHPPPMNLPNMVKWCCGKISGKAVDLKALYVFESQWGKFMIEQRERQLSDLDAGSADGEQSTGVLGGLAVSSTMSTMGNGEDQAAAAQRVQKERERVRRDEEAVYKSRQRTRETFMIKQARQRASKVLLAHAPGDGSLTPRETNVRSRGGDAAFAHGHSSRIQSAVLERALLPVVSRLESIETERALLMDKLEAVLALVPHPAEIAAPAKQLTVKGGAEDPAVWRQVLDMQVCGSEAREIECVYSADTLDVRALRESALCASHLTSDLNLRARCVSRSMLCNLL